MHNTADMDLLRQYAGQNSDPAFAELVSRHVDLVYSAALRKTGNPHAAEEITQAVFIILAQKAGRMADKTILPGWLYQTARLTAASYLKREIRRSHREQEAYMQTELQAAAPGETWEQLAPLLEDAMGHLGEKDRAAVVLRFFNGKSFAEVGIAAGVSENAAKKRVNYALTKLHRYFSQRGVGSATDLIAGAISANSIQAAPRSLATSITAVAITKGVAASSSILTLTQGALKIMAWTKAKIAVASAVGLLLAAGITVVAVNQIAAHSEAWRDPSIGADQVDHAAPQMRILPAKIPGGPELIRGNARFDKFVGLGVSVGEIAGLAYRHDNLLVPPERIVFATPPPAGRYDFIATLPRNNPAALQQELKTKLGYVGRWETREREVLLLKVNPQNAPGRRPATGRAGNFSASTDGDHGKITCEGQPPATIAMALTQVLNQPVMDQSGVVEPFSFELIWNQPGGQDPNHRALKQALHDQLGLDLIPSHEAIDMLVVEKFK